MINKIQKLLKSLKSQIVLPSIGEIKLKTPSIKSTTPKMPGFNQASKKNPVKAAEQIKNKDIKDIKIKEAQQALKINKSTGQWSLV